MSVYSINTSAPNLTVVCIDSNRPLVGRAYHYYMQEPQYVDSMYGVVELIDNLCDEIDYPQQSTRLRLFSPKEDSSKKEKTRETEKVAKKSELLNQKGDMGTFIVHVQYRQNSTWQGQVTWVDKEQTQKFRSVLELLKLMDSALDTVEEKAKTENRQEN